MKKRLRNNLKVIVIFLMAVFSLALSACSSQAMNGAANAQAAPEIISAGEEAIMYEEEKSMDTVEAPAAGEAPGLSTGYSPVPVPPNDRKLIRTVDIQAETMDFDKLVTQITSKVSQLGGYIEESRIDGERLSDRSHPTEKMAVITVRIPGDKLDQLVFEVEGNSNVVAKVETTQDVTLQYADVESRKKSLEIEQERVWALLEKAEDMDTILSLESHLTQIRYELESLGGQLRLYDNQVSYSTVQLTIQEVINLTEEPLPADTNLNRIKSGFKNSMRNVSNGLTNLFIALITGLPYIVVIAVVCLIVFLIYRLINRRNSGNTGDNKKSIYKKPGKSDKPDNLGTSEEPKQ